MYDANSATKNRDYVALWPDNWGSWHFTIAADAETVEQSFEEMLDLVKELFEACNGFVRPTVLEYSVARYDDDLPVNRLVPVNSEYEPRTLTRRTLSDESGVAYSDFVVDVPASAGDYLYVRNVEFVCTEVWLRLAESDEYVGRNTPEHARLVVHGEPTDSRLKEDPLHISVFHCTTPISITENVKSIYAVLVSTPTDIWFEDTEIGSVNRNRLQAFFGRLQNTFHVLHVETDSEKSDPWLLDEFVHEASE